MAPDNMVGFSITNNTTLCKPCPLPMQDEPEVGAYL